MPPEVEIALECRGVTIRYGEFTALSDASVAFARGRIHAVVGQNGAGKTTFARTCAGLLSATNGEVLVDGKALQSGHVLQARAAGVELVHQSFALPPSFTIAEAMEFGSTDDRKYYSRRGLHAKWRHHLTALEVQAPSSRRIRDLPVETQQSVEIARALVSDAKVLILDEPTAVLSPAGTERLFDRVRKLKAAGVTVILILHKIREVLAIAETVTVLRGGRVIAAALPAAEVTPETLADFIIGTAPKGETAEDLAAMVGDAPLTHTAAPAVAAGARPLMTLENVSTQAVSDGPALHEIILELRPGEIVGVAGVEGNGQHPLVKAMAGLLRATSGKVTIDGVDVTRADLGTRRRRGLRIVPFERNTDGLSLASSLWENWSAGTLLKRGLMRLTNPARLRSDGIEAMTAWDVRFSTPEQPAGSLSGGNAQKLIFSRELDPEGRILIVAQPTRGLDIGATAFVWKSLREARARGCAILLISSDLDELFDISDRLIVMYGGKIADEFRSPYDLSKVGAAMTGANK